MSTEAQQKYQEARKKFLEASVRERVDLHLEGKVKEINKTREMDMNNPPLSVTTLMYWHGILDAILQVFVPDFLEYRCLVDLGRIYYRQEDVIYHDPTGIDYQDVAEFEHRYSSDCPDDISNFCRSLNTCMNQLLLSQEDTEILKQHFGFDLFGGLDFSLDPKNEDYRNSLGQRELNTIDLTREAELKIKEYFTPFVDALSQAYVSFVKLLNNPITAELKEDFIGKCEALQRAVPEEMKQYSGFNQLTLQKYQEAYHEMIPGLEAAQ